MSGDITSEDFTAKSTTAALDAKQAALQAAHAQALAEINRIHEKAAAEDVGGTQFESYSLHEAPSIGKYVIPRRTGWKALLDIIHDPVPNIDFSANIYPAFDGIIGDHFQSPHLLDPLDDKFEARQFISAHPGRKPYEDLRDNLAAVRNFLLQHYYTTPPEGMSAEKAKNSLAEIAAFVGDGLYNNWLFLGIVPNHNPTKPFISLTRAQEPHGKGAQYIYEKILEHQRHSNWMKPFDAVMSLFGGKSSPDWQLPSAKETHFRDWVAQDIVDGQTPAEMAAAAIAAASNRAASIEVQLRDVQDAKAITIAASDIDAIGNHLVYTATNMEGVAHISNPVRRDAVDIAKDILRKLKVSIGNAQVVDGLQMKPSDDLAALGAVKGVAMVYERLVAWARGNNDTSIFQHPSVIAATQAIGQLGYQAKREGLRLATMAGNHELAKTIGDQLERLPASFGAGASGKRFGELLEAVESGINAIIYRTQQVGVDGAKVGFSVDSTLGSTLSSSPTAGTSNQVGVDNAAQRNAQAAVADQLAAQAQAQRINSQLAAQARTQQAQGQQQQQQQPTQPTPRGGTVGRQSLQAAQSARTQQRQTSATTTSTTPPATAPLNAAQQQAAARHATATALAAAREREEQQARFNQQQAQRQTQQIVQQKAAAKAASKIDPSLLKGFQNATDMKGVTGAPIVGGRRIDPKSVQASMNKPATPPQTQATSKPQTDEEKHLNQYAVQPPTPTRPTGGRGF